MLKIFHVQPPKTLMQHEKDLIEYTVAVQTQLIKDILRDGVTVEDLNHPALHPRLG